MINIRHEFLARVWTEWRDASAPYRIGPSLRIDGEGRVVARDKTLLTIPVGQWAHFEIVCGMGTKTTGTYDLTVSLPGQTTASSSMIAEFVSVPAIVRRICRLTEASPAVA